MRSKVFQRILDNTPKEVEIFVDWYADLVIRINQLLHEKGITKKELAKMLDKKPSEISKWLNGEHNFTLRSLAKLSAELGEPLLEVPNKNVQTEDVVTVLIPSIHISVRFSEHKNKKLGTNWQTAEEIQLNDELNYA